MICGLVALPAGCSKVGEFNPYNGVTNEMCHVYIARDLNYIGGTTDETEEFEVVVMSPAANHKEHGKWTKRWIHAMTTPVFVLLLTSCGGEDGGLTFPRITRPRSRR